VDGRWGKRELFFGRYLEWWRAAGIYFILTTDSDKDKAVVMSTVINSSLYVLARLTHDGGSSGCDIKYEVGL
jgi:hypothetical protein